MASSIINSDDGSVSGTTGLKTTGGDDGELAFESSGTEAMRIDSSGNVGVGTSSPSTNLEINGGANNNIVRIVSTDANANIEFADNTTTSGLQIGANGDNMKFGISGSERMRIDSSGNLLVSATTTTGFQSSSSESGTIAYAVGGIASNSASNDVAGVFNRLGTDGIIVQLKKDGSTVGSIGTTGSRLYIAADNGASGTGLYFDGTNVIPTSRTGALSDNAKDLGHLSYRWDDIYATNGTIQTSDRNEKQDIEELSEAETRVAIAAKGLLKKFRWKDAVAEKGDEARIHFGIIAQELQAAFEAEGLDAGRYAMFIHSTWWETYTDVPAVEAVDAVYETQTDEEGNEVQVLVFEAVEAKEAYTRTDTYDSAEEAPEGAVEKSRMGVRYSELLAFIIAAI